MSDWDEVSNLAKVLFEAIASGDVQTVMDCYSDDAVLINAATGSSVGRSAISGFVEMLAEKIPDYRYDEIRVHATASGFVQQHVIRGTAPDGVPFEIPACCVAIVVKKRVSVLEEYADSAQMAALGL